MENDESLYLKATQETEGTERIDALWAKSMALAEGDEKKAKYSYINLRVEQLKSQSVSNETAAKSASEVTKPISQEDTDFHNKYILVTDYAKRCDISDKTVRNSLEQGHLQGAVKDGKQYVRYIKFSKSPGIDNKRAMDGKFFKNVDEHQALESEKMVIVSSPHAQKVGNLRPQRKGKIGYISSVVVAIVVAIVILSIAVIVMTFYGILLSEKLNSMEDISKFKYMAIGLTKLIPLFLGLWLVKLSWKKIMAK